MFVDLIEKAGIVTLDAVRNVHKVKNAVTLFMMATVLSLSYQHDGLRVTFTSINPHPLLGTQQVDVTLDTDVFKKEISSARTVGFMKELEQLQAAGLAKGGSLENVLVYDDTKCLSVLRFDDELVRHKILDILGGYFCWDLFKDILLLPLSPATS